MTDYLPPPGQQFGAQLADTQRQLNNLQQRLNAMVIGAVAVTSTTHPPNPATGMHILETDTGNELVWNGTAWAPMQLGAWTPYAVVWAASGTAVSLGANGTLQASYAKFGHTVHVFGELRGGSSTTWGTGTLSFSLPYAANISGIPSGQFAQPGTLVASNAANSTFYTMAALVLQSNASQVIGIVNASGTFWSSANPATFATTAQAVFSITYETPS